MGWTTVVGVWASPPTKAVALVEETLTLIPRRESKGSDARFTQGSTKVVLFGPSAKYKRSIHSNIPEKRQLAVGIGL